MSFFNKIMAMSAGAAVLALTAGAALAEPAIIYDLGGKFDKSFNEAASHGAERWAKETGKKYAEIELTSEAQRKQALIKFADAGYNPIVMTGFSFQSSLGDVAPDYPDTKFVLVNSVVDQPNVRSVTFRADEGSYLAGVAAATASKSGTVGFIGGMDVPLIRAFACGYAQGVKATAPDDKVIQNMTGTTPAAWNDPVKGAELTKAQIAQGADVVYAAAGGTGVGVLQAAADENILSIGVDSNQNYMHPGKVLTSVMKRVDNAVYDAFKAGPDVKTGHIVMGVANGGVALAVDENNKPVWTKDIADAVAKAEKGIADGSIKVHNYEDDNTCPVQ